ncbi:transmembrane 220 family protein [Pedobacter sp. 22163]|uniref:transmembrane 220 family protein n=1 Tax=Pedobacter sp. 22163 TaxID=3453883 RepID=UPI003F836597
MLLIILNIIFCISFLGFAYVNLNDNDAFLWVSIYLSASICCGLAAAGKFYPFVYLFLTAFYLIYAAILFFAKDGVRDWITKYRRESLVQSMQATKPYIEQTREFFGLLIIAGALLINYFVSAGITS